MSMNTLIEKIIQTNNPSVVGLDPKLEYIPSFLKEKLFATYGPTKQAVAQIFLAYNRAIIDAIADIVPAIKPQSAYYEQYGSDGLWALEQTISYAKSKQLLVILDGKRNDIGTTMEAYANAYLGEISIQNNPTRGFCADFLTVNAYLGSDGIAPLLQVCKKYDKGIFTLVKTSNPSSGELQDQTFSSGKTLYETVGSLCEQWGADSQGRFGYSCVGAVVGATYPTQLQALRKTLPHTFFLVPGYGAQGGTAKDVAYAFDKDGLGAIINSSRAILCAYQKQNKPEEAFAEAARIEAIHMRDDITSQRGSLL